MENGTEYNYLLINLCEESLENFMKSSTLPDFETAVSEIVRQVLKGLADLNSNAQLILRRDIKPSTVLRDSGSKFLIADFGEC